MSSSQQSALLAPAQVPPDSALEEQNSRHPHRLALWIAAALAAVALTATAWFLLQRGAGSGGYASQPIRRGDLNVTVTATGNLQPTNQVEVGSELSGIVTRVFVDNNDRVHKGQILARLDTSRLEDSVRQGEAALVSAQAAVTLAEATVNETTIRLQRLEKLMEESGGQAPAATDLDVARAAYQRAQAALETARASVNQAKATLSTSRTQLAKADITSPVNGVVLARSIETGQTVAASFNAPVLFTLAEDLSRMKLAVKVDEADVGQVRDGMKATFQVDAYPGRVFSAVVSRLDLGATRTSTGAGQVIAYTATLLADNTDLALRPGMTATAAIMTAQRRGVLLIPSSALRYRPSASTSSGGFLGLFMPRGRAGGRSSTGTIGQGSQRLIYTLRDDNQLEAVPVRVGASANNLTEVTAPGLEPGQRVVTGQLTQAR